MFIDSHCHLTYEPLVSSISKIVEDCEKSSVTKLLTIGTNIQSSVKCIEISKEYENIYSSVGIHPVEAHIESEQKRSGTKTLPIIRQKYWVWRDRS